MLFRSPFAIGLGEAMQKLAREEEIWTESGGESPRLTNEPPYVGGNPNTRHLDVNPGVEPGRFDLWRDLRAMYTRICAMYEQQDGMEYFLFECMQVLMRKGFVQIRLLVPFVAPPVMSVYLNSKYAKNIKYRRGCWSMS